MNVETICIGIDFGNEFSQVSYYNYVDKEPETVDDEGFLGKYQIPTVVGRMCATKDWCAGDEAAAFGKRNEAVVCDRLVDLVLNNEPVEVMDISVMPVELVTVFLQYLVRMALIEAGAKNVSKICVTVENFNIALLKVLKKAFKNLGLDGDKVIFSEYRESFIYYILGQDENIYASDAVLFDYDENGLKVHRFSRINDKGMKLALTQTTDYSDRFAYAEIESPLEEQEYAHALKMLAAEYLEKKSVSSIFLTGRFFDTECQFKEFTQFLCSRRRVFIGQNLYSKGACYIAAEDALGCGAEYVLGCPQRITTGIDMKVCQRGKEKIIRLVKPGTNWFEAGVSLDFIADNVREMVFFLSPIDGGEKQSLVIPVSEIVERMDKTVRLNMTLSFTGDSRGHITITDRGFGEFYKSSGRMINRDIIL